LDFIEPEFIVAFAKRLTMRHDKIKSYSSGRFLITSADLWNVSGVRLGVDIAVKDGQVVNIGKALNRSDFRGFKEIAAPGLVILPAGVDAQVHLRVPGQQQKETAESGLWAAVSGGVGAMLTMPNTKPVLDNLDTLELAKREVAGPEFETGVKVLFSAAMTMGQRGRECVDFDALARGGVSAFTDDGVGVADDVVMLQVFKGAAPTGLPLLQHAEVPGHGGVLAAGPVQKVIGSVPYPESAEVDMVDRDLKLLKQVPDARYHVLHISAAGTLRSVNEARRSRLKVTCEVSPHHLFFTSEDIKEGNSSFKMNPPIRSAVDRENLRAALASGACDFMATDHAPHERDVKTTNFKTSAFGTTGLETSLRVLIDLWKKGILTESRLVDAWSTAPARFLGVSATFGEIAVGRPFNAVICDVKASSTVVCDSDFVGLSRNSCFIGSSLPGRVMATVLGQKLHCMNGFDVGLS
jgi:dihydroorotase